MTKVISAILLPAGDITEPSPVPVSGLDSLQGYVGGLVDAVSVEIRPSDYDCEADLQQFILIGYINDDGIALGLPLNKLATFIFERHIFGDVVLVSGTAPDGRYDGNNHSIPTWFDESVFNGSLVETVKDLDEDAIFLAEAFKCAISEGVIPEEVALGLFQLMGQSASLDGEKLEYVHEWVDTILAYYTCRKAGMPAMPAGYMDEEKPKAEPLPDVQWEITDEELEKFLTEIGGE